MLQKFAYCLVLVFVFFSCTSHPVISPEPLKPGETYRGWLLSAENVLPQVIFRKGLNQNMDLGLRLGLLPIYGSGLDLTVGLRDEGKRLHTVNFAGTYAEQSSFEATYYNIKRSKRTSRVRKEGKTFLQTEAGVSNYRYLGLRYAYYLEGLWGDKKHLFGVLYGLNFKRNWGVELGYFHDFSGVTPEPLYGLNPKYAPVAGLSMKIWFGKILSK